MAVVTITADEPRSIKAIEIAAGASQWLRVRDQHTDELAYGIPSRCQPGRYWLVTPSSCDCPDFRKFGLSDLRIGMNGEHHPCKHILAVRLYHELIKAERERARPAPRRKHLAAVPRYDDVFSRFED
jgi:hypothetical protein